MGHKITVSSGNLYADTGYADAEERQAKADQAVEIHRFMQREQVPAMAVAQWLRISESDVDNILHGDLGNFTVDQLTQFVTDLRHNTEIGQYFN